MKSSIVAKLEALYERHEEVQALLGDAATIADQDKFRALSREYAQLSDVARCYTDWRQVQEDIETAQMMLDDPEMREMAQEELRDAKEKGDQLEQQLQVLLLPKDPDLISHNFEKEKGLTDVSPKTNLKITALKVISHTNVLIKSLYLLQYLILLLVDYLKKDAHLHLVSHEYRPYYLHSIPTRLSLQI